MSFSLPPLVVQAALLALVLTASVYDVRFRRIPNWVSLSGVAAGLAINLLLGSFPGILFSLKGLAAGFCLYFGLYCLRAMGAGDVKMMAAVGALLGWQNWVGVFLCTAIIGGAAAIVLAASKRRLGSTFWNLGFIISEMRSGRPAYVGKEELDVRSSKALGLPHGAVIAAGSIAFLIFSYRFTQ